MTRESFIARDEADLFRTGRGPRFDPTPRSISVSLDVVEASEIPVKPADYRRALAAAVRQMADETGTPHELLVEPTPARVPEWVKDSAKWQSMTRAERRAVERHRRRQGGR